jgi:ketosteroid isomerase-like protein
MITKQKAREVLLRWIEAISSRDMAALDQMADEIFTPDYVWHFPGVGDLPPGPAGVKQLFRSILDGNPNFKPTLEDLFVEGDKVAVRSSFRRMDPVSGKPQHGTELAIERYVGDQIAEEWELISPWEDD